jgi:hypothetical protein
MVPPDAPSETLPTVLPTASAERCTARSGSLRKWSGWIGPVISIAIPIAASRQPRKIDWSQVWSIRCSTSPADLAGARRQATSPGQWPTGRSFRKLWGIPLSGIFPLLKKPVGNELLLGYVGEVDFCHRARRHVEMEGYRPSAR